MGIAQTPSFALVGAPERGADFLHFDYVNPNAPKGGTLTQGSRVSFDTTNGMRFPGKMANELDYIYDTLMVRAEDEPAAFYGLLAQDIEIANNFSTLRFHLQPEARWHDGTPLTAHDVAFTFETVAEHGLPQYRTLLDGVGIRTLSDTELVFLAPDDSGWLLLEFISTFPIFQRSFWATRDVARMSLDVPIGSGPYRIARLDPNNQVVLERVPDYWGADLPVNRGRWNFDRIVTNYFKDATIMVEAMRGGQLDVNREYAASSWHRRYDGPALDEGRLLKSTFKRPDGAAMITLVFNLRRPPLDDLRVRTALTALLDGVFVRTSFFGDLYTEPNAYYGGTRFEPVGEPSDAEKEVLQPFRERLPEGVFQSGAAPLFDPLSKRERLRLADDLLSDAGFTVADGVRVNAKTGEPLALEYVGANSSSRSMLLYYSEALAEAGIRLDVQYFDYVAGSRRILNHEWDLTSMGFATSFPPGQSERLYWHSEKAHEPGYALAGATDAAIDATIEAMSRAESEQELDAAARAFSRVLSWQRYMLPIAENDEVWIAHKPNVRFPKSFSVRGFHFISSLWIDPV
ncbi:MAG: extracellular solute-binding protein [Pseudomonadota bacterium]